jgi:stringent starvation protein B
MSEQSAKPFLVRGLYEWCVEQGYTPYLAVRVDQKTRVPMDFVKNGEIVLNVGPLATHKLTMDNDWVLFNARFNGTSQEVAVPFSAVIGIFAKETGYGMGFQPTLDAVESDNGQPDAVSAVGGVGAAGGAMAAVGELAKVAPDKSLANSKNSDKSKAKVNHLKVIK